MMVHLGFHLNHSLRSVIFRIDAGRPAQHYPHTLDKRKLLEVVLPLLTSSHQKEDGHCKSINLQELIVKTQILK